jgi:hypothetical protein
VQRVTVTRILRQVLERLRAFVRAGARHIVLLPCSRASRSEAIVPWLPDLLIEFRRAYADALTETRRD